MISTCQYCGKGFKNFPSRLRKGGGKFCSKECADASRKTRVKRNCIACGKEFEIYQSGLKRGQGKYCSYSCKGRAVAGSNHPMFGKHHTEESKKSNAEKHIGKPSPLKGKPLTEETKRKMRENHADFRGEKSPAWKGGITPKLILIRNSKELILWRDAVYERDNWTCRKCGDSKGGNLNAHHIRNFATVPELRTSIENGITLCEDCHGEFHGVYGNRDNTREQMKEFINQEDIYHAR